MICEGRIYDCLKVVRDFCSDPYARTYAKAALRHQLKGDELKGLLLYVLANTRHWRGKTARNVKKVLWEFVEQKVKHKADPFDFETSDIDLL